MVVGEISQKIQFMIIALCVMDVKVILGGIKMVYLDTIEVEYKDEYGNFVEMRHMPVIVVECSYCDIIANNCFISIDRRGGFDPIIKLPDNWRVFGNINTGPLYCCPICYESEVYKDEW